MEFNILKQSGGFVKQFSPSIFVIEEDEFYYKKKKNDENFKRYHISYLKEVYIQKQIKEKPDYILMIDLFENIDNNKKETYIKLAEREGISGTISQIKQILNVKRLQYDLNLYLYKYKEKMEFLLDNKPIIKKFEEESKTNNDKIINALKKNEYLTKNMDLIISLFNEKLNNFVKLLNQNDFNVNLLDEETINKIKILLNNNFNFQDDKKSNKNFEELEKFKCIYLNLIKLFSQIKFCFILKKFKLYDKKYLLEKQKVNKIAKNDNSDEDLSLNNDNKDDNEIKDENNINQNKNNIENRISKKTEQNEAYKSRILSVLNLNTKMKDNLKNMILTQNKKLFFCLVCNTLLEKTLLDKATCNFDSKCTSRSFFFCKKCKIHFCTKCIIYQRGLKCFQNHKYFPKPVNTNEDIKCFLCNRSKIFPYYECKYCKEQICSECSDGVNVRQNSCQNCNNELSWKKCLFTECDKCHKQSECFYFCICCDNSICLNCSNNPKGKCGALHCLEKIEFDLDKPNKFKKRFHDNYEILIDGKCSLCNITIGKTSMWACLRCSLFLCNKCFKRIND
jgi:hypothetical protein